MRKDRLVVGLFCIALSVWLFFSGATDDTRTSAVAIAVLGIASAVLGIVMVAISRKK